MVARFAVKANVSGSGDQLGSDYSFNNQGMISGGAVIGSADGCTAYQVPTPADGGFTPYGYDAGTIFVSGANDPVQFAPSGTAPAVLYNTTYGGSAKPLFNAGATITYVSMGGHDIGAFTGNVLGPVPIAGYTPPSSVSRSANLSITWTAATSSSFTIALLGIDPSTHGQQMLACPTTDTGSFTVTSAALSLLSASYTQGIVYLQRRNETSVPAGGWTIYLDADQGDERAVVTIGP